MNPKNNCLFRIFLTQCYSFRKIQRSETKVIQRAGTRTFHRHNIDRIATHVMPRCYFICATPIQATRFQRDVIPPIRVRTAKREHFSTRAF